MMPTNCRMASPTSSDAATRVEPSIKSEYDAPSAGDTSPTDETINACHGCDVLIHEARALEWSACVTRHARSGPAYC